MNMRERLSSTIGPIFYHDNEGVASAPQDGWMLRIFQRDPLPRRKLNYFGQHRHAVMKVNHRLHIIKRRFPAILQGQANVDFAILRHQGIC